MLWDMVTFRIGGPVNMDTVVRQIDIRNCSGRRNVQKILRTVFQQARLSSMQAVMDISTFVLVEDMATFIIWWDSLTFIRWLGISTGERLVGIICELSGIFFYYYYYYIFQFVFLSSLVFLFFSIF